ncbi:MAG: TIR domain-containing protein [Sphingomicrobium sp.]
MPQVFVSYARTDKRQVIKLVSALRKVGINPWWDDDIPPGADWEQTIEKALVDAQAVVVCWSPVSVGSENVRSEGRVARGRGRLVQVFLQPCDPPLFFGERQGIDLTDWNGSVRAPQFGRLKHALQSIIDANPAGEIRSLSQARSRWRFPKPAVGIAAGAIAIVALGSLWWTSSSPAKAASKVAVLPIKGLGGAPALLSVADGLTDQINTSLSDGRIPTVSGSDSDSLNGNETDQKLKSLAVGYTVSGTIERNGDTLHARLHVDDRLRHASLWSYETSGPADDPSSLNYAIAHSVASVISCAYRALGPGGLTDTELLSRYLRVCDLFVNHDDAEDAKSTFELLDDLRLIMAKAPNFAPAQSDFAKFGAYLAPLMPSDQASAVRAESGRAAKRALELDPHAADAYVAEEMLLLPTDWARREALLRKAISVDPKWPHANGFLAIFLTETGRMREAATYGQRAAAADLQLDWKPFGTKMACDAGQAAVLVPDLKQRVSNSPGDSELKWAMRWCLIDAGQIREAQATEDSAAVGTISGSGLRQAAEQALITGRSEDRTKGVQLAQKLAASDPSLATFAAVWSSLLGDTNTAFRILANFQPGYPTTGTTELLFVPQAEALHRDPRFFALMKRYGLAQFWQSTGRWPDFCAGPRLTTCRSASGGAMGFRAAPNSNFGS